MRYDLLVTQITNENARKVLAHQLARDPGTTFQDALLKLQKLPVVLFKDLDEQSVAVMAAPYLKYGVRLKSVPAHQKAESEEKNPSTQHHSETRNATVFYPNNQHDDVIKTVLLSNASSEQRASSGAGMENTTTNQLEESEKKKRAKERTVLIIVLLLFLIVPLILLLISSGKREYRRLPGSGKVVSMKPANGTEVSGVHQSKKTAESALSKRKSVSAADKKSSKAMCDSAKNAGVNTATLINFYKIAISFNKYNLDAWFGLLGAYNIAGMSDEYHKARSQMKELFGDKVFDVASQVKRFGDIEDMFENENGVLTIKYRSTDPTDELQKRVYSLIKILHSNYNYNSISVEIADEKTERMVVHVRPGMEIATFADFKKNASMMIFGKKKKN